MKLYHNMKDAFKVCFLFYALSTILLAIMFGTYIIGSTTLNLMDFEGWVFFAASCISHASQIALAPFIIAQIPLLFGLRRIAYWVQGVLMAVILVLNYLNEQVYALYRFHINGFVINMVTGPAAGDIFTFSTELYLKEVFFFLLLIALVFVVYYLASYIYKRRKKVYALKIISCFIACTLFAHLWNIYADFYQHQSVVKSGQLLPYYFPTTAMRFLQEDIGLTPPENYGNLAQGKDDGDICYPLHPIQAEKPDTLPNIVFIMIDSWNRRTLTPECMPNVYNWAQKNQWFKNHLSSSNGTRSAVFGCFFSLPGYYWEIFEGPHILPLFLTQLQKYGYDIHTHVSAGMQDPAFARVIFGGVKGISPDSYGKTPFENDTMAADDFIKTISKRGKNPFFSFLFFDLPHSYAGITKAENSTFLPAWDYADYSRLSNDTDPTPYFNLYRNCCHYDDKLIGKVLSSLEDEGLMDNTIVVIFGDHSQEFNENKKNYWGHNSNYSVHQIGVPLIIHEPNTESRIYTHRTTHFDIVPTLMQKYLGVKNPLEDYSFGQILQDSISRDWHIVGNNINYGFIIQGDTILDKKTTGALEVYDHRMNEIFNYKIDVKEFNKATDRLNRFIK